MVIVGSRPQHHGGLDTTPWVQTMPPRPVAEFKGGGAAASSECECGVLVGQIPNQTFVNGWRCRYDLVQDVAAVVGGRGKTVRAM